MTRYRISGFAERVGVPATTLRCYESRGPLSARRSAAGHRTYDEQDVERARFIRTAVTWGLSPDQIRVLIGVWDGGARRDGRTLDATAPDDGAALLDDLFAVAC